MEPLDTFKPNPFSKSFFFLPRPRSRHPDAGRVRGQPAPALARGRHHPDGADGRAAHPVGVRGQGQRAGHPGPAPAALRRLAEQRAGGAAAAGAERRHQRDRRGRVQRAAPGRGARVGQA